MHLVDAMIVYMQAGVQNFFVRGARLYNEAESLPILWFVQNCS